MVRLTLFVMCLFGFHFSMASEVDTLIKQAQAGDAASQFRLVKVYGQGVGTNKNPEKAKYWFGKAAESGYPEAQYWTGYKYFYGQDVKKNLVKALEWYEKSANQGYGPGQFMTGYIYQMGRTVDPDMQANLKKSVYWYQLAAQKEEMGAQFYLGCLKYFGLEIAKNQKEGEALILKASSKGQRGAQRFLESKGKSDMKQLQEICEIYPNAYY